MFGQWRLRGKGQFEVNLLSLLQCLTADWNARLEMCQWIRETLDRLKGLEIQYRLEG
jgi:hypothetical protein